MSIKEWEEFKSQPYNDKWAKLDDLTLGQFKEAVRMCKGQAVNMKEMTEIIQKISLDFNLSPEDAFIIFRKHGKDCLE